ncbi:MAG: serine/threonine-protein kinase [Acidobacteriota bacterium]
MTAPQRIGKYEIAEQIGVGGFGVVYKAWDPYIQRWVALKTCATTEDEANQRFFREAQLAGALQHPNITLIFDFGVDDGVPYFVQEFLTGTDLDELVAKKKLSLEGVLAVLIQVSAGLEFAHSRGIVHRDIKPANVRVLEDGTVKIMDFGIAKSLQAESRLTQTGVALGTAGYLAPEQLSGRPLDARTDIFSLGVMAYELVTSVRPFAGPNISNVIYQILHQNPVPPRQRNPRCPERVERIILKALAKNPDDRYASVHEFGQDLKEALAALSTRTQARRAETTTALVRGELARLAAGPGETVTAAAELAAQPLDHLPVSGPAPVRKRGRRWLLWAAPAALVAVAVPVLVVLWPSLTGSVRGPVASATVATPLPVQATPAPTPTPAPVKVQVELFADPVSDVSVDGRELGRIQTTTVELTAGRHVIRQRIAGYLEKESDVEVTPETRRVALQLPPFGLLSVVNDFGVPIQGAEVSVDGRRVGTLPIRERKVEAGSHEVKVSWPDGRSFTRRVVVPAAGTVPVVVRPE